MAPFRSALTVLLGTAAAGASVQSDGASAASSVSQIRDTLRNLLRSIEDNGRDADTLLGKRQLWCDNTIQDFDVATKAVDSSLSDMQAQLTETEAEVEEAEGTVQQVRVDIEMVQHTIKQTQDMLSEHQKEAHQEGSSFAQTNSEADISLLGSLVENKQLSLSSLQGEIEVAVPVLAQLQASVADTRQRVSYRGESAAAAKVFMSALRDGCQGGADRTDTQAAARVGETNSIHVALQALDELNPDEDSKSSAPSFIQMDQENQEVTVDDLSDLFATDQQQHPAVVAAPVFKTKARETVVSSSLRPRIQTLLTQLKDAGAGSGMDQTAWCSKQRESSAMALKFAKDSVAQIASELDSHTAAEAELSEELERLQSFSTTVSAAAKMALEHASKEEALIQSSRKDQVLATKILDQAMTILKELAVANTTKVVDGLTSARKMFTAQIQAAPGFQQESIAKAKAISANAMTLTKTQENEQHNLEFSRDDHAQQRLANVENKRLYEADVQEASAYAQKLEESCKADADSVAKQQRTAQVQALEDADKALDGKLTETKSAASSLRGVETGIPKPLAQNLTPMQRAAAEMGIPMN
jgi:hypothetical protein